MRLPQVIGLVLWAVLSLPAQSFAQCAWHVVNPPSDRKSTTNQLYSAIAFGPNDVWALGSSGKPEVLHYAGSEWTATDTTPIGAAFLEGLGGTSSSDLWAVGSTQGSRGLTPVIAHWNGTTWQNVSGPPYIGELISVVAIAPNQAWAVGWADIGSGSGPNTLIERYDGQTWSTDSYYQPDKPSLLQSVTGSSVDDLFAGGYGGARGALIEKYDSVSGTWVNSPTKVGDYIDSVSARSASEAWAVGPPYSGPLFISRYNGIRWRAVRYRHSSSAVVYSVDASSASGQTWIGGIEQGQETAGFVDMYDGRWHNTHFVQPGTYVSVFALAAVPGTANDVWAFGLYYKTNSGTMLNLAEHYSCSAEATSRLRARARNHRV